MKLYDGLGPNPKIVRMFMAEKGIDLPKVTVDLRAGENRQAAHLKRNPSGQLPTLETDDGRCISEVTAICEYLEEKFPQKPLIGTTPEERGETRMWTRKVDLMICEPMANGFRFGEGLQLFKERIHTEPDAAPGLKRLAAANLKWLDKQLEGKTWIAGSRFSLADILLFGMMSFFTTMGQPLDPSLKNVAAWFERVKARPSAAA
jgi:glutathione S-transferase